MTQKIKVCTFAAFHYDVAYQKTFAEYLEGSLAILDAGLALLQRRPRFVFAVEQVLLAREYVRRNPSALPAMRRWAQGGRLVFLPGLFTMPDANIPCGESFVRNFLIGRRWLKDTLGIEPTICWMADIFGHHPQLPQLARQCGYLGYLFERGKRDGDDVAFWWEGIDGSRILAQWEIDTYYGLGLPLASPRRGFDWMADYADREVLDPLRDHSKTGGLLLTAMGGDFRKPSEEQAGFLSRYNRLPRRYSLAFAPPERYFREVRRRAGRTLPALASDFNPLMQGTYSSRIRLKQANRRLENLAFALGLLEGGRPEPRDSDRLWETIAWNAFHDIICGTLTTEAFREALRDYARAEVEAGAALAQAIVGRAGRAGRPFRTPADHAVALFNPLPYARNELVEIPLVRPGLPACRVAATTPEGRPLESQTVACGSAVSVLVNLPLDPASIRSIGLRPGGPRAPRSPAGPLRAGARRLENDRLRAVFGANGTIVSLVDKDHGTELVPSGGGAGMNNFVRQYDHGDLWSLYRKPVNGSLLYTAEQRDPLPDCTPGLRRHGGVSAGGCDTRAWPARIRLAERGPLRAALEIEYPDAGLTTRVSLARDEKLLRFRTRLIPAGKRWRLRAVFPTTIRAGTIRRSIPCGFVRQPEGEFPAQDWIDYSDGEKGVCLINAGLPGNNVTDGILCLSLFRAVAMEDRDPLPWYEEGMEHVFDYALRPFGAGDKDYRPAREGARFNQPIRAAFCGDGAARILGPICAMKGEGVEWMGFRRGDDGSAEIRLYESEGRKTEIELVFPHRLRHGVKTDFTGTALKSERVAIRGATATVRLRPFEIAALRIR